MIDHVFCPLVDRTIEDIECIEARDVADRLIRENFIPDEYRKKEQWREICKKCKYHDY